MEHLRIRPSSSAANPVSGQKAPILRSNSDGVADLIPLRDFYGQAAVDLPAARVQGSDDFARTSSKHGRLFDRRVHQPKERNQETDPRPLPRADRLFVQEFADDP